MNYEELLAARGNGRLNRTMLPIGEYYREQVEKKYRGWVDIRQEMISNIVFAKALKQECERNKTLVNSHQLHVEPIMEHGDIVRLEVEQGNYMSFEQLLNEQPAVLAEKGFIDKTFQSLIEITSFLHKQDIRHVCYSPKTVFVRKGDKAILLLSHGSFYLGLNDQQAFYGTDARYVAPEVLSHGTIDERCDIYSIGKFMEYVFERSDTPIEYKKAIKKAVGDSPEDRFNTAEEMLKAVKELKSTYRYIISCVAAVVIALLCLALYFDSVPESQDIEFVKSVATQTEEETEETDFDTSELDIVPVDSVDSVDFDRQREYQAKAEAIFRKNYEKEADRILSKIYNKEFMSNSERQFIAQNQSTIKELMELQQKMGEEANLTQERSQLIATEIIERVTERKKKEMGGSNSRGVQLPDRK